MKICAFVVAAALVAAGTFALGLRPWQALPLGAVVLGLLLYRR